MYEFDEFLSKIGIGKELVSFFLYGSRIYGTSTKESDYDYIVLTPDNIPVTEVKINSYDFHSVPISQFKKLLENHDIKAFELYFNNFERFHLPPFFLDLIKLRESISEKASHSFVKAKKKIDKEKDTYIGLKSLFHSLRILNFGIQIASTGRINDYTAANKYWNELKEEGDKDWSYFKGKYQPIYNSLATEFRKLAPKE